MKVLVTGGAGYIGSTICSALEDAGHVPVVLDNLLKGPRVFVRNRAFYEGDIADEELLARIFSQHPDVVCVVHCAALIVVPESEKAPFEYYRENVCKTLDLLRAVSRAGCTHFVFSSSAAVYAPSPDTRLHEASPVGPSSPYARSKLMTEQILADFCTAYGMKSLILRYFNPMGADPSLRSGMHARAPSHVVGKLLAVASGAEPEFHLTGVDWPTRDGTGMRDYVHVWDLARAHVAAVRSFSTASSAMRVMNIGSGSGNTVRELVTAFERVLGRSLPVREAPRRPGDVAGGYADPSLAMRELGWQPEFDLERGIVDTLRWNEKRLSLLGYA